MNIKISGLNDGEHHYQFRVNSFELDISDLSFASDIIYNVILTKTNNQFDLKIDLFAELFTECDKCLDDINLKIYGNFEIVYKYENLYKIINSDSDNFKQISYNQGYINLKNDFRDFLLLSIPMRKIPEEVNGLCSLCSRRFNEINDCFLNGDKI